MEKLDQGLTDLDSFAAPSIYKVIVIYKPRWEITKGWETVGDVKRESTQRGSNDKNGRRALVRSKGKKKRVKEEGLRRSEKRKGAPTGLQLAISFHGIAHSTSATRPTPNDFYLYYPKIQGRRSRPSHWHAIGSFLHIDSSNLPLPLDTYLLNDLESSFLSKKKPSPFALWKTMLEVSIYSFNMTSRIIRHQVQSSVMILLQPEFVARFYKQRAQKLMNNKTYEMPSSTAI
uniref:Uncharacterized protein n=1 Tax=Vespula pensylvanica TaxID=30213 RepID=A0A834P7P7_VESPE|nr:hypothetical protein H0235_004645 [Vespula pensylvanica]